MKSKMFLAVLVAAALAVASNAAGQMSGSGQGMMQSGSAQQRNAQVDQDNDDYGMMGGGYGMGPGMMDGGYGMGNHQMMRGYGWGPNSSRFNSPEQFDKFLNDTKDLRKKLHDMKFEYMEKMRDPQTTVGDLKKMQQEMYSLRKQIQEKAAH